MKKFLKAAALLALTAFAASAVSACGTKTTVNDDGTKTKTEHGVKITETAAKAVQTEKYETADFSLNIPKGWKVTEQQLRDGLKHVSWPGRFELLRKKPVFFVDGGHNPQCMAALAKNLEQYLSGRRLVSLTGVMADKDYFDMYKTMEPYFSAFVTVTPENPRALPAEKLAEMLAQFGKPVTACASVREGVQKAMELAAGENDAVVAFGSLYMVGDIRTAAMEK